MGRNRKGSKGRSGRAEGPHGVKGQDGVKRSKGLPLKPPKDPRLMGAWGQKVLRSQGQGRR